MLRKFSQFMSDLWLKRELICQLTRRDFSLRYMGSYLGLVWAFVQPMVTILVFWFVFEVGFRSSQVDDCPFVVWLICGMVPWFFFAEAVSSSCFSIVENSHLVKKVVFRVSVLPIVKLFSALLIHLFFVFVVFAIFFIIKIDFSIFYLQVLYYSFSLFILLIGVSWMLSALVVFLRDIGQAVANALQFLFWLTPIFWSIDIIPEKYHFYIKLNPVYYVVQGFRDSFIHKVWFWQHPYLSLYFWAISGLFFFLGALVFMRLRPHFSDVL